MLRHLFGPRKALIKTLASWEPDMPAETLDLDALTRELISPDHPGLRAILQEYHAVPPDAWAGWPRANLEGVRARLQDAAGDRTSRFVFDVLCRMPLANWLWNGPVERRSPVRVTLQQAMWLIPGSRLEAGDHGLHLSLPELERALREVAKLFHPSSPDAAHFYGQVEALVPLCRLAARDGSAACFIAIERLLENLAAGARERSFAIVGICGEIADAAGLDRGTVPVLRSYDAEATKRLAVRAQIASIVGPALAPVLEALFEAHAASLQSDESLSSGQISRAAAHPAMTAYLTHSPDVLGQALLGLLTLIDSQPELAPNGWNHLFRRYGLFHTILHPCGPDNSAAMNCFNAIATLSLRRKVTLPDEKVAILLRGLDRLPGLQCRDMLNLVINAAKAHPDGATAAQLREMATNLPDGWKAEIERPLAALAPPDVDVFAYVSSAVGPFAAHFRSLFDIRLHDAPHRAFLRNLREPDAALIADRRHKYLAALGHAEPASRYAAFLGENNFVQRLALRWDEHLACALKCRAGIRMQIAAVSGFVDHHPAIARKFAVLAEGVRTKSGPTLTWMRQAADAVADLPRDEGMALLRRLIEATVPDRAVDLDNDHNLRMLIYVASMWDPSEVGPLLTDFALRRCYQTDPGFGIRAEKLGNACLWTLIHLPDGSGVPFLGRLLARVKYPKIRAKIDAALNEAAAAAGMTRGTLDELTVPTHGLDGQGRLVVTVGEGQALVTVGSEADLTWLSPGGKPLKAPSTAMKEDAAAIKAVKQMVKEIDADLGAQRLRLQRLYLDNRSWQFADWCERYRDHPLLQDMVRRLIWWVETDGVRRSARAVNGRLEDASGAPVVADGGTIRLWHPIEDTPDAVLAWRDQLEAQDVVQPFAQTWREIYRLTDAERATATYTNRWAGHILKQHQAMTLGRINSWTVTHRMSVDAPNDEPWHLVIPAHGLVADYWVDGAGGDDGPERLDSGAYVYVTTDRLTFHRLQDPAGKDSAHGPARAEPAPLETLPPVVLSEVMRHCDLFTAVASIASDPMWRDRGADAAHPNQWQRDAELYWAQASFADLSGSGKIRRELLERLVPRLAFADRCGFDDQALTVQGRRHKYRIHLGSAAVQIAATRQHVCIVPKAAPKETIRLPFAGDPTLSLILSKAALLVRDDKITDPVILAQI